jgi:hypothetical protein
MSPAPSVRQVTELQGLVPEFRRLIGESLAPFTDAALEYDFYREWNGGWRVRVELSGSARGRLEFVLFYTPADALLALPHPTPAAWRGRGFSAADGTRWMFTAEGDVVPVPDAAGAAGAAGAPS